MRFPVLTALGILLHCFSRTALAAPPDVKWVFPTGAQIGQKVTVKVSGKINQPGTKVWCDNPGITFEIPEKDNDLVIGSSADAFPGLYWMRFFNAEGATVQVPFVLGRLPEVVEVEPNNEVAKAQAIDQSSVINAKLGAANDVDVYAITLKKGQTLVAQIDANWRLGFPVDPIMQILSANGTVIEQVDDDHGFDPMIAFEAPADGTWLIRVFGFPATPNSTIRFAGGADYLYRLTMTSGPVANHVEPAVVQRDSESSVKLVGWNLTDALSQPIKVDAETQSEFTQSELPHEVSLTVVDEPVLIAVEPCNAENPVAVKVPTTVCGVIDEPADEDSFQFSAKKGDVLVIAAESRSLGHPLDTVVTVFDKDGKSLGESDDAVRNEADSRLVFSVKADGDYTVRVKDLFENGGWRFAYRLSIRPRQPSAKLTLKADVFAATPGTPLEIPVTIARNDGFNEEVTISIQDLPEGATVEPVKSEAKGDTSKAIKLILKTDEAKPFNGPLRIVGQYGERQSVSAEAELAAFNRSTRDIWLTILPKKEEAKPKGDSTEK